MNTFNLNLDLDKRGGVAQWVTLRQGDHNGTELRATIYDHGTQAGGGYTCRVSIRLPGAGDEYYRETATYTNGVAVVTVDEEYAAAIVGVTEGYFELLQGDAVIASTESFGVRILRSAQDGAVPGDKYDSAIEDALAELDEATGRISQMVVDATEEYLEAHPELTTTVEDNSLTDAKLIQHGGILDRVARLWHRLDNLLTATPAESDALTVTDAAKTPMAGLALYGRSTQEGTPTPDAPVAIQSVEPDADGEVKLRSQGKNLFNLLDMANFTSQGMTVEWIDQTSFHLSGTPTRSYISKSNAGGSRGAIAPPLTMTFEVTGTCPRIKLSLTGTSGIASTVHTGAFRASTTRENATLDVSGITIEGMATGATYDCIVRFQLEKGTTATDYAPYVESVTPIDLQGHALRSLPDGTRDEVTVDQYGHAVLTQRVGEFSFGTDGWETMANGRQRRTITPLASMGDVYENTRCSVYASTSNVSANQPANTIRATADGSYIIIGAESTLVGGSIVYPIEPVTIDLGTVDPIALQGPDMTAQSVPTAPFALTYERDFNTTLARLEASIAELATN